MAEFDDSGWPLVRVHMSGPQSGTDLDAYFQQLEEYLSRGERFAVLATSDGAAGAAEPGAAKRQMAWMAEHAEPLSAYVAGMASVVSEVELDRQRSRGAKLSSHLPYPMEAFSSEADAAAWLTEQLGAGPAPPS